ncbi:hypothetical protein V6D40_07220 [Corynebacterium sp. Q4381]|uniref:hypothetical protein n=1 Tax=Corynebacterium sp. Marseille-Q4381 TaxID=3121597 RepID=UPI002FE6ABC1
MTGERIVGGGAETGSVFPADRLRAPAAAIAVTDAHLGEQAGCALIARTTPVCLDFLTALRMNEFLIINNKTDDLVSVHLHLGGKAGLFENVEHLALTARRDLGEGSVFDEVVGEVSCGDGGELDEDSECFVFFLVVEVGGDEEFGHEWVGGGVVADP